MKYKEELEKFIEVLEETQEIPSFFKTEFLDFKQEKMTGKKKVGIIGDSFYSLYVRVYGLTPVLITGGSYFTGEQMDMFPQISDPIAKASIGLLLDPEYNLKEELSAVVVVAKNDSYKKAIAYLKEMGITTIQIEPIPFIREGVPFSLYKQQLTVLNDISKLVMGVFQEGKFKNELKAYEKAYELFAQDSFQGLPTITKSFFTYVLHMTGEKEEFCTALEGFLQQQSGELIPPQVTLMGSAMHLPNYKVFRIFQDIGITHFENECMNLPNYGEMEMSGGAFGLFKKGISFQHKNAFIAPTVGEVNRVELEQNTGGIIYYLLKGQISEAYQAERMEELAIKQGVPFLCVETDYTYTDSEQMKIRVEAFYEMLRSSQKIAATV